jgi:transcriptional regulator GlxA family with amidase domain
MEAPHLLGDGDALAPSAAGEAPSPSPLAARRVLLVGYPDFQMLDVVGPLDAFGLASRMMRELVPSSGGPLYEVELAALRAGAMTSSAGLTCVATRALVHTLKGVDTILVAGGRGALDAARNVQLNGELRRLAPHVRRMGSMGSGAFVLAAAGLLDGRRVTTPWETATELAAGYPRVAVEVDATFLKDGPVYTSAGLTAGVDLALALIAEDHGRDLALSVARALVVFASRSRGQPQHSALPAARPASEDRMRTLQQWMVDNPDADLSIGACARRVAMSPRNFARVFTRDAGMTPGVWVEGMRVERARALLVDTRQGIEQIASMCGFGTAETMRRAFIRRVRASPSEYRQRFQKRELSPPHPSRAS